MRNLEHKLQVECVRWFRLVYSDKIIFAIPNGGKRNLIVAKKLKAEGVLAGVPDLFIPEPNKTYAGLFIEMKYGKKGRLTEAQKEMIDKLRKRGYKVEVARSIDDFVKIVKNYFKEV